MLLAMVMLLANVSVVRADGGYVTRSEFLQMIASVGELTPRLYDGNFDDVTEKTPGALIISSAAYAGVIEEGGEFRPNDNITREEAVGMAVRALQYAKVDLDAAEEREMSRFRDLREVSDEEIWDVFTAMRIGLVGGGELFEPKRYADEEYCAAIVERMGELKEELPVHVGDGEYDEDINFVRDTLRTTENEKAEELYNSAMQVIYGNGTEDEVERAFEEIRMAKGLLLNNRTSFLTGEYWYDDNGGLIQAHGGGILYDEKSGLYYWYGEARETSEVPEHLQKYASWGWRIGVACYSSSDLYNWKYEGLALEMPEDTDNLPYPESDIGVGKVLERPKVIYNEETGKYVMWMHIDNGWYGYSRAGVAVADSPTGPFEYLGSYRPGDKMGRDMTVFQDDDGTAYIYFSTDENGCLAVCKLSEDYLSCTDEVSYCIWWKWREAPAVFKYNDTYYMITSGCTGWAANEADYATASSPMGPWTQCGNPCVGDGADVTFGGQSAYVLPYDAENGKFIFIADIWRPDYHSESGFIWLPIQINSDGSLRIEWFDEWTLDDLGMNIDTVQADITAVYGKEKVKLPYSTVLNIDGEKKRVALSWQRKPFSSSLAGIYTVEGSIPELGNAPIKAYVRALPENLIYFVSCGGSESGHFESVKSEYSLSNSVPDKEFGKDTVTGLSWGYEADHTSGTNYSEDMYYSVRYDYSEGGEENVGTGLNYSFEVQKGVSYDVYVGVYDPWEADGRVIDVSIQGVAIGDGYDTADGAAMFAMTNVQGEDGFINISVTRDEKSLDASFDPIISWIMIAESDGGETEIIAPENYEPVCVAPEEEVEEESEEIIYRSIRSAATGKAVSYNEGYGLSVSVYEKQNPDSMWSFEKTGYGTYIISSQNAAVSLDVPNGRTDAGLGIVIYQTIRNVNQRWYIEEADGGFLLKSEASGLYLTNKNGTLTQEERDEALDQVWKITIE